MEQMTYGIEQIIKKKGSCSEWLSESSALVLENKSLISESHLSQNGSSSCRHKFQNMEGNISKEPPLQPIYHSIHPSKHPSSLLSTKPKPTKEDFKTPGFVNERVRALSVSNKSAAFNPLTQSVGSVQGFLSGLSSKHSGKLSIDTSSFSGYSTVGKFSRGENHRASYNDKKSAKMSMFTSKSSKRLEHYLDCGQENKWYSTGDSDSDSNHGNGKNKRPDGGSNGFILGKKYQQHHQSSSSLDLDLDATSTIRNQDRSCNDRRLTPLLHREFGSQGSIDIIGKYSDDSNPEFVKEYQQYKRGSDPTSAPQASSPKPRPKRLTSKLWGDKDRPSIFRKLKSSKGDGSKDDESFSREAKARKDKEDAKGDGSKQLYSSISSVTGNDESLSWTPSHSHKSSSRVTSLLCTSNYNANTSFSSTYAKTDQNELQEMGSIELLADSRLSSIQNKGVQKTKSNSTKTSSCDSVRTDNDVANEDPDESPSGSSKQINNKLNKSKSKNSSTQGSVLNSDSHSKNSNNSNLRNPSDSCKSEENSSTGNEDELCFPSSPYVYQPGFAHHDVKSMSAILLPEHLQVILSGGRNTITGATAAAIAHSNMSNSSSSHSLYNNEAEAEGSTSSETLVNVDNIEQGDGRSNSVLQSCPYFCNELGGENDRNVALTKESAVTASLLSKCAPETSQEDFQSLNSLFISKNPWQYLHRPTSAATAGVLEPVADWLTLPNIENSERKEDEKEQPKGVFKQEMCTYAKSAIKVEEFDSGASYYKTYFCGHEHQNYFGIDDGGFGPIAISYRRERIPAEAIHSAGPQFPPNFFSSSTSSATNSSPSSVVSTMSSSTSPVTSTTPCFLHRVIVRTAQLNTLQGSVVEYTAADAANKKTGSGSGGGGGPGIKDVLEYICPKLPLSCLHVAQNSEKAMAALHRLDSLSVHKKFKAGVLYCKANQTTEEEMYGNKDAGPAFEEFLEVIGQRVRMKGFNKHRAGLDPKNDSTGEYSVYSPYQGCEVMFHVSTLLPYTPTNTKQLLRKRHIGNDIVTIVFQEPGSPPFSPHVFRSHFQHIFIVVRAINPCSHNTMYNVAVTRFHTVPAFGPPLPAGGTFTKGKSFASFLLAKVINGEIATLRSEKFTSLSIRTRYEYLKDLVSNHCTSVALEQPNKFSLMGFSRGLSSRRDKGRTLGFCPSSAVYGALSWSLSVQDCTLNTKVDCTLGISLECLVVVEAHSGAVLLAISSCSVLGWTVTEGHSIKVFYHQGESLTLSLREDCPEEHREPTIASIAGRLEAVSQGAHTQNVLIVRRKGSSLETLLGFNVQQDGVVTEVQPSGAANEAGLRPGARIMEICYVALPALAQDMMVDLLKTSKEVNLLVIPPYTPDGVPRRGCNAPACAFQLSDASEGDYENLSSPESSGSTAGASSLKGKGPTTSRGHRKGHGATESSAANALATNSNPSSGYPTGNPSQSHPFEISPPSSQLSVAPSRSQPAEPPHPGGLDSEEDYASLADSTTTLTSCVHPDYNTGTISSTTTVASNHSGISNHSYKSNHSSQSSKTSHSNHSARSHLSSRSTGAPVPSQGQPCLNNVNSVKFTGEIHSGQPIYDSRSQQSTENSFKKPLPMEGHSVYENKLNVQEEAIYDKRARTESIYEMNSKSSESLYDSHKHVDPVYGVQCDPIYDTNQNNDPSHNYCHEDPIYDTNPATEPIYDTNLPGKAIYGSANIYDSMKAANTPGIPYQSSGSASPFKKPYGSSHHVSSMTPPRQSPVSSSHVPFPTPSKTTAFAGPSSGGDPNPVPPIKKSINPTGTFLSNFRDNGNSHSPPPLPARFAQQNKRRTDHLASPSASSSSSPSCHSPQQSKLPYSPQLSPQATRKGGGSFQSTLGMWQQYGGGQRSHSNGPSNYAVPPFAVRPVNSNKQDITTGSTECEASQAPPAPVFPRSSEDELSGYSTSDSPQLGSKHSNHVPLSRSDTPSSSTSSRTESPLYRQPYPPGEPKPKLRSHKKQQQSHNRNSGNYNNNTNLQQELYKLINPDFMEGKEYKNTESEADSKKVKPPSSLVGQASSQLYKKNPADTTMMHPPPYRESMQSSKFGLNRFPNDNGSVSLPPSSNNNSKTLPLENVTPSESLYESISLPVTHIQSPKGNRYTNEGSTRHNKTKEADWSHKTDHPHADRNANEVPHFSRREASPQNPTDIIDRLRGGVKEAVESGKFGVSGRGIVDSAEAIYGTSYKTSEVDQEWTSLVNAATHAIGKTSQAIKEMKKLPQGSSPYHPLEPVKKQQPAGSPALSNPHSPNPHTTVKNTYNTLQGTTKPKGPSEEDYLNYNTSAEGLEQQEGCGNASQDTEKMSLQHRISELEAALLSERSKSSQLSAELSSLRSENARLQEDSRAAARQLHHFTDWFFATIDKT